MTHEFDLEERLLDYSVMIIDVTEDMIPCMASSHVGNQLLRCGTSPLFNHGEAQAAESVNDFVHKMKICLKELRESRRALKLIHRKPLARSLDQVAAVIKETEELIKIFFVSIRTARKSGVREERDFEYGSDAPPLES